MAQSFGNPIPRQIYINEIDLAPISLGIWDEGKEFPFSDLNWRKFLYGCGLNPIILENFAEDFNFRPDNVSVSKLVHIIKLLHGPSAQIQGMPSKKALVEQLHDLRSTATRLAHLAQGGDGNGTPSKVPEWYKEELGVDVGGDGSLSPTRRRAIAEVHPFIHEALHSARNRLALGPPPQGEKERRAWGDIGVWFVLLHVGFDLIDEAIAAVERSNVDGSNPKNRPGDIARKWALSRLLWIWRDAIGREIIIGMKRTKNRVELEVPEPNPCLRFVIAALEHISPVPLHQYNALITELNRARKIVPPEHLLNEK